MAQIILPDAGNCPPWQNIVYKRNTTWIPAVQLTQGVGGAAYPIPTGARVLFLVKINKLDDDSAALLSKDNQNLGGLAVTNQATGALALTILATDCADTQRFPEGVPLYYGIKLIGTGLDQDLLEGNFTVSASVVQA